MKGAGGTSREQLEQRVPALEGKAAALVSENGELRAATGQRGRAIGRLGGLPGHCTSPGTPPSASSPEWREEGRQKGRPGEAGPAGKRGGQAGHAGVSRRRGPEGAARRRLGRGREGPGLAPGVGCARGGRMGVAAGRVRGTA